MMSFPFAFCLYRYVFGIIPVYTLSFLSIYVILAIGASDHSSRRRLLISCCIAMTVIGVAVSALRRC